MMEAKEFEYVRTALCNGLDREILDLKHFMEKIDENTFSDDTDLVVDICIRIYYASEGIKKLASALEFFDCWEENGEPPQLSRDAHFKKVDDLKDWQKEIMMHDSTVQKNSVELMKMDNPSEWIDNGNNTVRCPNCNSWFHLENAHYMYYCGYCGCKMNPTKVQQNNNYGSVIVTVKRKKRFPFK